MCRRCRVGGIAGMLSEIYDSTMQWVGLGRSFREIFYSVRSFKSFDCENKF